MSRAAALDRQSRKGLSEEVTLELRPETQEGVSRARNWGEESTMREHSMCKCPEVGPSSVPVGAKVTYCYCRP